MRLFDTHIHLDVAAFENDRAALLGQAIGACEAYRAVIPGIEPAAFAHQREVAIALPNQLRCAFGIHPLHAHMATPATLQTLADDLADPLTVAVGEIGLDALLPAPSLSIQESAFVAQLIHARKMDLPVILHLRKTHDRALSLLRRFPVKGGIVHAFNGSLVQAQAFIERGFMLGFGGAATGARALHLQRLFTALPIEALVLETDAPWMNPAWQSKGSRNEPQALYPIAQTLASLRKITPEALGEACFENACHVLSWPTHSGA
jgi:TatD DNase family protein